MDPHSFFTDPDPAALYNADLNPASFLLYKKYLMKSFQYMKKTVSKKKHGVGPNLSTYDIPVLWNGPVLRSRTF